MFAFIFERKRRAHKRTRDRFLLPEEWRRVRTVLLSCPPKVNLFFHLAILTAARRGELLAMEWDCLDLAFGIWHKKRTKNGRTHTLALSELACKLLADFPRVGRYVFVGDPDHNGSKPNQPWSATSITFWWKKVRRVAGVEDCRIHDLRRTLGAWMTMHGESIRIIQTIMNHSDISVTARCYTPFQIETQRAALNRHAERVIG